MSVINQFPYLVGLLLPNTPTKIPLCTEDRLANGEMREITLYTRTMIDGQLVNGSLSILLIKQNGNFRAMNALCPHCKAHLENGVLSNGRLRCPADGACFSTVTGDIEDFPGLDGLNVFNVWVQQGIVHLVNSNVELVSSVCRKALHTRNPLDQRTVLIIGGGPAAQMCAQTLRIQGFTGRLVLVTKESHLPYDRTKLSKDMDINVAQILLRDIAYYDEGNIEVLCNTEATRIDVGNRMVAFGNGQDINYAKLLIATGSRPVNTEVNRNHLTNICTLRTPEDAQYIRAECAEKDVVVNGNCFIAMETAAFLSSRCKSMTIIGRNAVPFWKTLGNDVGLRLKEYFKGNGVRFCDDCVITEFRGENGKLTELVLNNEQRLAVDVCVNGIGVVPATEFVVDSGVPMTQTGLIPVDEKMRTGAQDVYAAGDIVQFPLFLVGDRAVNIAHYQMAMVQGKIAALNMLEKGTDIRSVPYFSTDMFDLKIRYSGFVEHCDEVLIKGSLQMLKFAAYYISAGIVVAVASIGCDPVVAEFAELAVSGRILTKELVELYPNVWYKHLNMHLG